MITNRIRRWHKNVVLCTMMIALAMVFVGCSGKESAKKVSDVKNKVISAKLLNIAHKQRDVYTEQFQKESQDKIDIWKTEKDFKPEDPMVVRNAFGTNTGSVFYYAKTSEKSYVVCSVEADGAGAAKNKHTLKSVSGDEFVTEHEYQIVGLTPGAKNKVTMEYFDEDDNMISSTSFDVTIPKDKKTPVIEAKNTGDSKKKIGDGIFAMFGYRGTNGSDAIYLFDTNGVSKGSIPTNNYRGDRLEMVGDNMVYSVADNELVFVNRLGKIDKIISTGQYIFHHDIIFDEKNNTIIGLVTDTKRDTVEDGIISVDLNTEKVTEIINWQDILPEIAKESIPNNEDWIHINSLDIVEDNSIVISSREQSALIKIDNIYKKPTIDYIIHQSNVYEGTKYEDLLLKQTGDKATQAGQHTITVDRDESLEDGQYYLYMFDNNFKWAEAFPNYDWKPYPSAGEFEKGDSSYYNKYLVDSNKKTYQLVKQFKIPYSSIVSSVQHMDGNIPFSSGKSNLFGEYDSDGKLIKSFRYKNKEGKRTLFAYRVMKYDFKGFYFK